MVVTKPLQQQIESERNVQVQVKIPQKFKL